MSSQPSEIRPSFNGDSYAVTWSPHQDAFDIATVAEMIATNREIFEAGGKGDFVVMGILPKLEDARAMCDYLTTKRDERLLRGKGGQLRLVRDVLSDTGSDTLAD